jgi:hypothetical protein
MKAEIVTNLVPERVELSLFGSFILSLSIPTGTNIKAFSSEILGQPGLISGRKQGAIGLERKTS